MGYSGSKRRQKWSWKDSAEELFDTVAAVLFRGHTSVVLSGML